MQTMPHSSELTLPAVSAHLSVAQVLRLTYGLVPIVAGLDKLTNFLTNLGGVPLASLAQSVAILRACVHGGGGDY